MRESELFRLPVLVSLITLTTACLAAEPASVVAPGAKLVKVEGTYEFTEGPAADANGNVYFSDVRAARCYYWTTDGKVTLWREDTGNANGQAIDRSGNLLACEGGRGRVVSLDPQRHVTVVADQYQGKRFNQPNDLWIDPHHGVYFTDPIYGRGEKPQGGEHVYYVSSDRKRIVRVIDDMVRPNGLAGTPDGKMLYVSDHGAKQIYLYDINADGTLAHKRLFASVGADGMKLDAEGNLYMAEKGILVYDSAGKHRETIEVPEQPTNLCFAGKDGRTLFITARPAVYTLQVRLSGASQPERARGEDHRNRRNQDGGGPPAEFRTEVPAHPADLILGRPTKNSITLSVLAYEDIEGYVAYGTQEGNYPNKTPKQSFKKGQPVEVLIGSLKPNTRHYYQFRSRASASARFNNGPEYTFHTPRPPGSPFVFTITADPHLDEHTTPELYQRTLVNALADTPDFHIDLGDTFMTDKYAEYKQAHAQYLAQRYYFGLIGHSAPVFLVLGNHDGEAGSRNNGTADNIAVWSNMTRKRYFPNPVPDGFYSGNKTPDKFAGLLQDYYAWQWGDALLVVLDPFWYTRAKSRGDDNWGRTLGAEQYSWLKRTLESSKAKFRFVFVHHLVGGARREGRGGAEAAKYFEWGGQSLNGSDDFKQQRPGWPAPIHQVLVQNRVSIVFHGHDHLFAKQDLDGIVYQELPQPGLARYNTPRTAAEYGYVQGDMLGGSGHLRVVVSERQVNIAYILSCLPADEREDRKNGTVGHSYTLRGN